MLINIKPTSMSGFTTNYANLFPEWSKPGKPENGV